MTLLANVLVVACLGLMPDNPVAGPVGQTVTVETDGGTVLLGGVNAIRVPTSVAQITVVVPDRGTILLGGLKRLSGSVAQPAVVVPDGGTILLSNLKRLR